MPLKILVVEDSESDRRLLLVGLARASALARFALRFFSASDGEEALEIFRREQPDLVITDLMLPKLDGFALCAALRARPEGRQRPIIAVTGVYRGGGTATQLRERYNVELLFKPVDLEQLSSKALALLEAWTAKAPGSAARWQIADEQPAAAEPTEGAAAPLQQEASRGTPQRPAGVSHEQEGGRAPLSFDRPLRGTLKATPLARLIADAALAEATGTLQLARGTMQKVVYLRGGRPVFVDSNLRSETSGSFFVARGTIDEAQLSRAIAAARKRGKKLGETLVALGIVDAAAVAAGLRLQTQIKIASALRWSDGTFSFAPGEAIVPPYIDEQEIGSDLPNQLEPVRFVLAALKRFMQPDQLGADLDQTLELTLSGAAHRAAIDEIFGPQLLASCARGLSLRAAIEEGIPLAAVSVQAAALRIAGLAELEAPKTAPPAPPAIPPALDGLRARDTFDGLLQVTPPSPEAATFSVEIHERTGEQRSAPRVAEPAPPPVIVPPPLPREVTQSEELELELELEPPSYSGGEPPALQLKHLAESRPAFESVDLQLELIESAPMTELDEDSGVLDLSSAEEIELLELEEPHTPAHPSHHDAAALSSSPLPVAPPVPFVGVEAPQPADIAKIASAVSAEGTPAADLPDLEPRGEGDSPAAATAAFDLFGTEPQDERLAAAEPQSLAAPADRFGAELFFQDGRNRLRANDWAGAIHALESAIEINPEQADYHAYHGWALFLARGRGEAGALAARPILAKALTLDPDSAQAHELAAQVERDVRNYRAAAGHLAQTLACGPLRMDLFDQLRDALSAVGDFSELERQYRLMVFRLREADVEMAIPLWVDLAYLYLNKLGQPEEALVALEVVSGLAPNDPRVRAAAASIGSTPPEAWEPIAKGLRQRLIDAPDDATPLHELFKLHRTRRNRDALFLVSALLVGRKEATSEEEAAYRELYSTTLLRGPIAAEVLEELRDRHDDPLVQQLIALLAPALCERFPVRLEAMGSDESQHLAVKDMPQPFADAVRHACSQLDEQQPIFYLTSRPVSIEPMATLQAQLVVGQDLLHCPDGATIAFAAARALSCLDLGRRQAFGRRARELKTAFLAAYSMTHPEARVPDPEGEIGGFREVLARHAARDACAALLAKLRGRTVNLSDWVRAVHRTAARIALVACGDPGRALPLLTDAAVRSDLTGFALSERYEQLRRKLLGPSR